MGTPKNRPQFGLQGATRLQGKLKSLVNRQPYGVNLFPGPFFFLFFVILFCKIGKVSRGFAFVLLSTLHTCFPLNNLNQMLQRHSYGSRVS